MSHIMYSITDKEFHALHGLEHHTQEIFMHRILPWVTKCNGKRKATINIRTLNIIKTTSNNRVSTVIRELTDLEVTNSLDSLQRRKLLKVTNKSDKEYEIELMFDDEL